MGVSGKLLDPSPWFVIKMAELFLAISKVGCIMVPIIIHVMHSAHLQETIAKKKLTSHSDVTH